METKVQKIETKRRNNRKNIKRIADACGCSVRQVTFVLDGKRGAKRVTALAQKIQVAATLLEEGENKLLEEVKRVVNF